MITNTTKSSKITPFSDGAASLVMTKADGTTPVLSLNTSTSVATLAAVPALPSQTAKQFLAAPNAADGVPSFRAIVASDVPTLNQNTSGTAAGLSSALAYDKLPTGGGTWANGGNLSITGGNVGVGCTPAVPLEIKTTANSYDGLRLNGTNESGYTPQIEWYSTYGTDEVKAVIQGTPTGSRGGQLIFSTRKGSDDYTITERMRISDSGKVGIGCTPGTTLSVNGYTQLGGTGSDIPKIKTVKLTGTTPSSGGTPISLPSGVAGSKILSVSCLVAFGSGPDGYILPNTTGVGSGYVYYIYVNGDTIQFTLGSGATEVASKAYKIIVTYEE
jgi:hypothetical protein